MMPRVLRGDDHPIDATASAMSSSPDVPGLCMPMLARARPLRARPPGARPPGSAHPIQFTQRWPARRKVPRSARTSPARPCSSRHRRPTKPPGSPERRRHHLQGDSWADGRNFSSVAAELAGEGQENDAGTCRKAVMSGGDDVRAGRARSGQPCSMPKARVAPRMLVLGDRSRPAPGRPRWPAYAIRKVAKVDGAGASCAGRPCPRISCSMLTAWITEPAPRKSSALKKACVVEVEHRRPVGEPAPTAMTM